MQAVAMNVVVVVMVPCRRVQRAVVWQLQHRHRQRAVPGCRQQRRRASHRTAAEGRHQLLVLPVLLLPQRVLAVLLQAVSASAVIHVVPHARAACLRARDAVRERRHAAAAAIQRDAAGAGAAHTQLRRMLLLGAGRH
jgi:hypothetical protein